MYSQMIVGGSKVEETAQFRTAMEEQQKSIRQQYDRKLQDIEKERQQIEEVIITIVTRNLKLLG